MTEQAKDTASGPPSLVERLEQGFVVCAEGYVFELERRGYLQAGGFVPEVVLEHPEVVRQLHHDFVHAGSDVVETLTYYGHREKLRVIGKEDSRAAQPPGAPAREGGRTRDTTPCSPATSATRTSSSTATRISRAVRAMFEEQVAWAVEAGVDFVVAETYAWAKEALIAVECQAGRPARRRNARHPSATAHVRRLDSGRGLPQARGRRAPTSSG